MSEIITDACGKPIGAVRTDPNEDIYKVRDDFEAACANYERALKAPCKPLPRAMRYFVDTDSSPRRFYAVFLQPDPNWVFLLNVEEPADPVYCLSLHDLFHWGRYEEVGIVLDNNYYPTAFRLNKGQARK